MRSILRFLLAFLVLTAAVAFSTRYLGIGFGQDDFWDHHGLLFLVFVTVFPRLTLLFSTVATGGLVWWLGWLFAPRILVATLATLAYWQRNPILVVVAWLVAVGGESSEKYAVVRQSRAGKRGKKGFDSAKWV